MAYRGAPRVSYEPESTPDCAVVLGCRSECSVRTKSWPRAITNERHAGVGAGSYRHTYDAGRKAKTRYESWSERFQEGESDWCSICDRHVRELKGRERECSVEAIALWPAGVEAPRLSIRLGGRISLMCWDGILVIGIYAQAGQTCSYASKYWVGDC